MAEKWDRELVESSAICWAAMSDQKMGMMMAETKDEWMAEKWDLELVESSAICWAATSDQKMGMMMAEMKDEWMAEEWDLTKTVKAELQELETPNLDLTAEKMFSSMS